MNKTTLLALLLAVSMLALPACGGAKLKTEGVTGVVTLDGTPLPNATVYFCPTDSSNGTQAVGKTNASGEYKLQTLLGKVDAGTTPGSYEVYVTCEEVVEPGQPADEEGNGGKEEVVKSVIPAKYNSTKTSGLTAEVAKGANTINFELTSK